MSPETPESVPEPHAAGGRARTGLLYFLSILLGFGVLVGVAHYAGISQSLSGLRRLSLSAAALMMAVYSIAWLVRGQRLRQLLGLLGTRASVWESTAIEAAADLANYVLPAKLGDVAKVVCLKKRKSLMVAKGIVAAFLVRLTDLTAVVLLAGLSMVWLVCAGDQVAGALLAIALLGAVAVAGLVLLFLAAPSLISRLAGGRLGRLVRPLEPLAAAARVPPAGLIGVLATATVVWTFEILTFYSLVRSMGVELGLTAAMFALMLANLSKVVPLTPLGLGVFEGAMVFLLEGFGVARADAFAVALMFHAFANVFTFLLGIGAVFLFRWNLPALRRSFASGRAMETETKTAAGAQVAEEERPDGAQPNDRCEDSLPSRSCQDRVDHPAPACREATLSAGDDRR
jgi:uncharacterized membrane protein YbhN (UPF0104 family)